MFILFEEFLVVALNILTVEMVNVSPLCGSVTLFRIAQMELTRLRLYAVWFLPRFNNCWYSRIRRTNVL